MYQHLYGDFHYMALIILEIVNSVNLKSKCYFNFHICFYFVRIIEKYIYVSKEANTLMESMNRVVNGS